MDKAEEEFLSRPRAARIMASRRDFLRTGVFAASAAASAFTPLIGAQPAWASREAAPESFSIDETVSSGHKFFGSISRGLAEGVEAATRRWGRPNAYILGQEGSAAFVGGLRYGEGKIYTRRKGERKVFWQGPSLGFDAGLDGDRTMMLIYNLPQIDAIFRRYGGVDGSAYFIGGFGFTALTSDNIVVTPIRSGIGARLGVNVSYLKFTPAATWNPF